MINLSKGMKRILERVEKSIPNNDPKLEKSFRKLKESLENGSSEYLGYESGDKDDAIIKLVNVIRSYYLDFPIDEIEKIENDVYFDMEIEMRKSLIRHLKSKKEETKFLKYLFEHALNSKWGDETDCYKIRKFILIQEKDEINKLKNVSEFTKVNTLQVFVSYKNREDIYKEKGLFDEYCRIFEKYKNERDFNEKMKAFDFWYDVRQTAVYYIYV